MDKETIKRLADNEKLAETDKEHIFYAIDNSIKAAKFKTLSTTKARRNWPSFGLV